jgi:hypothetical protein
MFSAGSEPVPSLTTATLSEDRTAVVDSVLGAQNTIGYLPFLDGLRAISILLVLGFHQLGPITGW